MKSIIILLFVIISSLFTASAQSWQELIDSTNTYMELQDFQTALQWAEKAEIKAIEEFGEKDTNYINSLTKFYLCYYKIGNIEKAIEFCEKAKAIIGEVKKEKNTDYVEILGWLGFLYGEIGNFTNAEPLLKEALEMGRRLFKRDNQNLINLINNMASFYSDRGQYNNAEPLYIEALELSRDLFKGDNPDLVISINNMAYFYYGRGRYAEAESLFIEALEMNKGLFKGDHPNLASSINNMAVIYKGMGRYAEAELLYKEALEMRRRLLKGDHPSLATSISNMAVFYYERGRYADAEPLFKEAIEMRRRLFKGDHSDLAMSINNIAGFYNGMGRFSEAEPFYKEALEMYKRIFKEDHPDLAMSTDNMAVFYNGIGRYTDAEPLYKEALEMRRRIFKGDHPDLARSINNIAELYNIMGRFSEAEPLYKEALEIFRRLFKGDHPSLARSINNMAYFYNGIGRYAEAEPLYKEALDMYKRTYKGGHPNLARSIINIAVFLDDKGRYAEAESLYFELINVCYSLITNYFSTLSEKEKEQFWATMKNKFEAFNTFAVKRIKDNPSIVQNSYNNQLITKGMLLGSTQKVRNNILNSGDKDLIRKYEEWLFQKGRIAKFYSLSKEQLTKKGINLDSIINDANAREKELSRLSEDFAKEYQKKKIEWQEVQKQLKPEEAAVEIVRFRYYDKNRWTDTVYYGALLLTSRNKKPIEFVIFKNGNDLEDKYLSNYYSSITHQLDDKDSYNQYWKPIADKLKGIKKVYLSVDGVYNQINLNTLKNPKTGEYLLSEKDIVLVTSTRDLVERRTSESPLKRGKQPPESPFNKGEFVAELFGDPKFNIDSNKHIELAMTYKNTDKPYIERGIVDSLMTRGSLTPLPGTRKEIENIYRILKTKEWGVNSHLGEEAIEEAVKTINSPRVLHIATHGMFLKDIDKSNEDERMFGMETKRFVENPLLRSMLLFAGADNTISKKGESTTETKTDDGLLTAYEAMNLNLDNTELVVLSACETGLGEIKNGEGVYGLQRAFVQAGAKSIIMSLWKVSDEASQELMTSFYTKWLSGKPKRQAFREAQIDMMKQHPEPFYWGAFVMVGE